MDAPKPKIVSSPPTLSVTDLSNLKAGAIVPMLCAVACYAATDAMVKWLSGTLSIMEITFFRSVFTFIPVGFVIHRSGGLRSLRTDQRTGQSNQNERIGLAQSGHIRMASRARCVQG